MFTKVAIKEHVVKRVCSTYRRDKKRIQSFSLRAWKQVINWETSELVKGRVKMDFNETVWVEWNHVAQDMV
jgi:hypothetical protein